METVEITGADVGRLEDVLGAPAPKKYTREDLAAAKAGLYELEKFRIRKEAAENNMHRVRVVKEHGSEIPGVEDWIATQEKEFAEAVAAHKGADIDQQAIGRAAQKCQDIEAALEKAGE